MISSLILAAGLGTRMRSERAKVLHAIGGRTLIEWVIMALRDAGIADHVVVVGHQAAEVQASAGGPGVRFVLQAEQRGTGHAAQCAAPELPRGDEVVLVTVGDAPLVRTATYRTLLDHHAAENADATVLTARLADPTGYGRILRATDGSVRGIVEHGDASPEERAIREINSGIYAFRASALHRSLGQLDDQNAQGEIYLTDTLALLVAAGRRVHARCTDDPNELMGINTRAQLAAAGRVIIDRHLAALMDSGVTIEAPQSTWIEPTVEIGRDALIAPFVYLGGRARLGAGCRIGAGAVLHDVEIGAGEVVPPGTCRKGQA